MKRCVGLFVVVALCSVVGSAQITNLMINGVTANFSFQSGDAVTWTYNLPTGGTATGEIWYDINQNGVIDPAVDIIRYYFTQTDGVGGDGGPPDLDGSVNGQIFFSDPIGVAPGKYVVK